MLFEQVMEGENEMMNLAKVWLSVFVSLCYCHWISKMVPKGRRRLLCVLPIVSLFLFLPLNISSVHFTGITGFFIAWLANFKLLLFAFGKGPLNSDDPSISLGRFVALACLPIKITQHKHNPFSIQKISHIQSRSSSKRSKSKRFDQKGKNQDPLPDPSEEPKSSEIETNPSSVVPRKGYMPLLQHASKDLHYSKRFDQNEITQNPSPNPSEKPRSSKIEAYPSSITPRISYKPLLQYAIKGILLAVLVKVYNYSDCIHPNLILGLYCVHIYFLLELSLAVAAAMARAVLGLELEPQFNDPFLSTSLQDFWGRRWNLMVTSILRPTVYEPTLYAVRRLVGPTWAPLPAVIGTFVVSAAMHELIMYYIGRLEPSFRMTWFFLLHGLCLTVEIALKKAVNGRWRLPRLVSGPLTVGFVLATCFWLFLPEFLRCRVDVRAFEEYAALGEFVKNVSRSLLA